MTFVVGENCIKCVYTDCVEVCPVDCFYLVKKRKKSATSTDDAEDLMLVIHPDECIDCALCEPECPADAIYSEDELPDEQREFLDINEQLAQTSENITEIQPPPKDADQWMDQPNKRQFLQDVYKKTP